MARLRRVGKRLNLDKDLEKKTKETGKFKLIQIKQKTKVWHYEFKFCVR